MAVNKFCGLTRFIMVLNLFMASFMVLSKLRINEQWLIESAGVV